MTKIEKPVITMVRNAFYLDGVKVTKKVAVTALRQFQNQE